MNWESIYKQPFHTDEYGIYMFSGPEDNCSVTALQCITDDSGTILKSLCNFLNNSVTTFQPKIKKVVKEHGFLVLETDDLIEVRGWGYLTGVKRLQPEEAAKIQDEFLDYIVDRIKKSQEITGLY